ncbi:DNA polymerase III subunit gamma/tau [Allorhodopirellula solitaria]|uniref:DNA polymerase III subunit gamma/tau n=1 Tax=Allorhodopirellula solitaria TaxID=2527987 RepID=A0A5C5YKJ8_9BACT|nr:DNA polymerase III subunit gamma/tau [Allorhodopirellula solitaria]TWT75308.1 DNA polymerase III subunit tau [Allorhodopirellula solitaria]
MGNSASEQESGDDSYVVVARRYRPRDFDQLVGQDHVAKALQGAIETSRVGHAYLFTGARGVGKTSTARIFAKALNHPGGPTSHPDSESDVAQAIDSGEDVDVIEIDGASNRGIDEIRSLRANVGVRPSRSRYKIYIIDEVHMLTGAAFNALLKTLEEPPEHVKFIFCTTDPEKIPITVLSRCQRFDFAPVESSKIVGRLREIVEAENSTAEDEALELIARRAAGSMRDSQSLLEQVLSFSDGHLTADQVHAMLGTADDQRLHRLAQSMQARDAAAALAQVDEAIAAGVDAGRLTEQMLGYFRDLMTASVGCDASMMRYAAGSMHDSLVELGQQWGLQTVLAIVGLVDETLVRIRHSVHARVLLESTLIQICHLPDLQAIVDLTAAAQGLASDRGEKKNAVVKARPPATRPAATAVEPATPTAAPPTASAAPATPPTTTAPPISASAESTQATATAVSPSTAPPSSAQATESPSPAANGSAAPISEADLQSAWQQILDEMDPMTATLVKATEKVAVAQEGTVELTFPEAAGLAMSRCGSPQNRDEIVRTIARVTGRQINLNIATGTKAPPIPQAVAKPKTQNRMQRMREIESNPMVRACIDLLGAEIVRIDTPRS